MAQLCKQPINLYGNFIPLNHVNDGIGMRERSGYKRNPDSDDDKKVEAVLPSYRMPSRTFTNWMTLKAAGVEMKLIYVPSETNDELSGFVPEWNKQHRDSHRLMA